MGKLRMAGMEEMNDQIVSDDEMHLEMMDADCMSEVDVLAFLEKWDTEKPQSADKIMVPEQLANYKGYEGPIYGYIREESGYHVIIGWKDSEPADVLETEMIGYVGKPTSVLPEPYIYGTWKDGNLEIFLKTRDREERTALTIDVYAMKQDAFSRNSGLIETDWMDEQCAVICGCGSVGSGVALQLARSGVGRFVLVDTDCMEIHNVCRHQCDLTDVGRYKVDAVADRIYQINPQAQVKKFYMRIQEVRKEKYEEWITPDNAIFIGTCDNRLGDACACDLAYEFGAPFASLGFMTRAWAGEIYTCLPERHEICYRCAFKTQIDSSIVEERRNHFYIGEEELQKAHFEPGLDVDLEFGISLFDKVILDILNRNNLNYVPRLYNKMTQYLIFSGTDDRTFAESFWEKAFPTPIGLRSLCHSDECRRCEHCRK